jgi:phosphoglycolate phosphatase-like HAD superfamily hydrolase
VTELGSWNDTAARAAIEEFVTSAAEPRVAVLDNDGTLWCEKPMPIQLDFILRRWGAMAEQEPSLRSSQPWKAAYERDHGWLSAAIVKHYRGDDRDLRLIMGGIQEAFEGMAVDAYAAEVAAFFAEAQHPTLGRPYRECAFLPMIELLRHLEANGVATFIASGGDRDFMRAVSTDLYGIPAERVVGSSYGLKWSEEDGLVYKGGIDVFDDGPEKPVRIWSRIGRRPALGCGNANGDVPMLRFSTGLRLLVVHDDAEREFDYTAGAEQARAQDFTKISVKDDWATVFA